jgi:hypothetical protein
MNSGSKDAILLAATLASCGAALFALFSFDWPELSAFFLGYAVLTAWLMAGNLVRERAFARAAYRRSWSGRSPV